MFFFFFSTELIPGNNTIVSDLPATLYCQISGTTEMLNMDIPTEWYIDGVPLDNSTQFVEYFMTAPNDMQTNLTITTLTFIRSPVPFIEVSCRTSIFPDVVYGLFKVGKYLLFS